MEPGSRPPRPTRVRRRFLALLLALAGLTLLPAGGPASASCAAPYVDAPPSLAVRGEVTVTGRGFADGCQDSGSCPAYGCGECDYGPPPVPTPDVRLDLVQRGRVWLLGTADADDRGTVTWQVTVPDDVRPGHARLVWTGDPQGVPVEVTAG